MPSMKRSKGKKGCGCMKGEGKGEGIAIRISVGRPDKEEKGHMARLKEAFKGKKQKPSDDDMDE